MLQIQRRLAEAGRIRIGKKGSRGEPQKLTTFRLTSPDRNTLQQAAAKFGGSVQAWNDPAHQDQFELITKVNELPIWIVRDQQYTLWYELWTAGGCKRRCDGTTCTVPSDDDGSLLETSCQCDPNNRECKIKLRVSFLLPDLSSLGVWRLDTGSIYAAMEMPGMLDILYAASFTNRYPEAVLALETRRKLKQLGHGKTQTQVFPVCTVRVREELRQLMGVPELPAIPANEVRLIPDAGNDVVAEQTVVIKSTDADEYAKARIAAVNRLKQLAETKKLACSSGPELFIIVKDRVKDCAATKYSELTVAEINEAIEALDPFADTGPRLIDVPGPERVGMA